MGIGDELMAAGEARRLHKLSGLPSVIVGRDGRPRWTPVWEHNPYILQRAGGRRYNRVLSGGGERPYIAAKSPERWTWKPYKPIPAQMFFTPEELAFAEPYRDMVMLEPNVKSNGHANKAWVPERWDWLALILHEETHGEICMVTCTPEPGAPTLSYTRRLHTPTFRPALAVLSVCKAFVGTEGGLMHGAAAVGTPAVILWSEFISPDITGYPQHRNIRHAGKACGMRTNCPGCRKSMEAITVDEVVQQLKEIL